ncbi:MAG: hypothetical protein ABJU26_17310, partial [Flavobacteriaceae bacterium]
MKTKILSIFISFTFFLSYSQSEDLNVNGNIIGPGIESSITNFKNIIGRSSDGILHLRGGNTTGPIYLNYYESGNISLANGGGNVG